MPDTFPLENGVAVLGTKASLEHLPGATTLARDNGPALWRQIAALFREKIDDGSWQKGSQLPSAEKLADHFQVNRHTVRQAISSLCQDGLLKASTGRGTFVYGGPPLVYTLSERTRFADIMRTNEQSPVRSLISKAVVEGSNSLCSRFDLPFGTSFHDVELRFGVEGFPLMLTRLWLPVERFKNYGDSIVKTLSPTRALALYGLEDYMRKTTQINAKLADERETSLLDLSPNAVLLTVDAVNYDMQGKAIQLSQTRFAADRIALHVVHDD